MFLPRSTFQIAALCLALFTSFVWFFGTHVSNGLETTLPTRYMGDRRAPATLPYAVHTNVRIDESADDPIRDIQNRTLGFQKIYAISMPHRIDKKDYLSLMALVSDLDIEFIDGVNGSEIHPKALPAYWGSEAEGGNFGCWRAHLNIYQLMVRDRIRSALVLEDDVDWDVLLKAQMTEVARGTRYLRNATLPMHSPYGDNWDLITLGHSGVNNNPTKDQHYWLTKNDPTVLARTRQAWSRKPDLSAPSLAGDHIRYVHEVVKLTATTAYAVSLRGAARLLYDQSMLPNAKSIDMAILKLCRYDAWGLPFCLGAYPMLFGRYRAIGPIDKDSDRKSGNENESKLIPQHGRDRLVPESELTVFPVSLNIGRLLKNEHIIPSVAPKKDLMPEVDLKKFVLPKGQPVFVKSGEYVDWQAAQRVEVKDEEPSVKTSVQMNGQPKQEESKKEEASVVETKTEAPISEATTSELVTPTTSTEMQSTTPIINVERRSMRHQRYEDI